MVFMKKIIFRGKNLWLFVNLLKKDSNFKPLRT